MRFLQKCWQYLIKFFRRTNKGKDTAAIPLEISDNEIIVRGIVTPLFWKKKGLEDSSFLPPPKKGGRKDVSVLRHQLTNSDFCKQHSASLQIGTSKYCGLAVILAKSIEEVNCAKEYVMGNGEKLSVTIKATPDSERNLPMHADILYSHSLDDDEPKTLMRIIARQLIKKAKYLKDPDPTGEGWKGEVISHQLFQNPGNN